uniref:Conserved oligomeric Golgi complex subunit 5 n=1 Tax=Macrostomum lignano TaxID=282301 RepID=A0A1I8GMW1_9PLAT
MNGEEADNFLAVFEGDSFDEKSFAINVLQTQVVSEVIEKIDACIGNGIDTLESVLSVVQSRTDALLQGLKKIRARIGEPYARLEQRVLHLRRVQSACDFLRRSGRIFALAKKLPPQPAAGVEEAATLPEDQLGKVAQTLGDLGHQFSGLDWRGVHALEREHRRFARWREAAETRATALLVDARGIGSSS